MSTDGARTPQGVTTWERETCPVTAVLRRVGDKWRAVIIRLLSEHGYGFNELDRAIEGISRRMLTHTFGHWRTRDSSAAPRTPTRLGWSTG